MTMEWMHMERFGAYKEVVAHLIGAGIAALATLVVTWIVHWYRTAKYGKLVRIEVARLDTTMDCGPSFVRRPLIVKPALELLHQRRLAGRLVNAYNRGRDGYQLGQGEWTYQNAQRVLQAVATEVQEAFAQGTVGWAIGDKDVTVAEFVLVAYRHKKDVLMLLFRPEDLKVLLHKRSVADLYKCETAYYAMQIGDTFLLNPQDHALAKLSLCM